MEAVVPKTKEASTSQEGDGNLKKNEAIAGLVGSVATKPTAEEVQLDNVKKLVMKGEDASAAEDCDRDLKRKEQSAYKGSDILKKKKAKLLFMAVLHFHLADDDTEREALLAEAKKEVQLAEAGKRMKVVTKRFRDEYIQVLKDVRLKHLEVSEDDLRFYSLRNYAYLDWINAVADYKDALIKQHEAVGCAVDETEVTDDEEEIVEN